MTSHIIRGGSGGGGAGLEETRITLIVADIHLSYIFIDLYRLKVCPVLKIALNCVF